MAVFNQVQPMLYKIAWRYSQLYPVTFEEAKSEAYWCFLKACRIYRAGRRNKFSSWCYFVVTMQMKSWIMRESKRSAKIVYFETAESLPEVAVEASVVPPLRSSGSARHCGQIIWRMIHETPAELWDLMADLSQDGQELVLLLMEIPQDFRGTAHTHLRKAKDKMRRRLDCDCTQIDNAVQELGAALLTRFRTT